MFLIIRI